VLVAVLAISCGIALNKGAYGKSRHGAVASSLMQRQPVSDIYTMDHSRYHLLIVILLAQLSLGSTKVLGSSLYTY
jgi:hypothetical protein